MAKRVIAGFVTVSLLLCFVILSTAIKEDFSKEKVDQFFRIYWQWRLNDSPEYATLIGNHDFDDKLESYALQSFRNRKNKVEAFFHQANSLLSEEIDPESRLNLEILVSDLSTYISGYEAKGYVFPITFLEGVQIEFEILVSVMPNATTKDYQNLISRYRAFPLQVSQIIDLLKEGMKLNMTSHAISMNGVVEQFEALQQPAEKSVFYKPFLSFPDNITTQDRNSLQTDGLKAVGDDLLPAFKRLQNFIETEYMKSLRPNISVTSLPDGVEFYQKCLDFNLGIRMSPEEVHEIGLKEVERIGKEMSKVIASLQFNMSRLEFSEKIRGDPDFYFNEEDELLEAYKDTVINRIRPRLPKVIKTFPKSNLSIEPAPPSMKNGPVAYYFGGTPDGSRPGIFYLNTAAVNASPKYEMVTLSLHEAEPGHHLQISYLMEMETIPDFRRYLSDGKYNYGPSQFPHNTAFIEGWGLYSEYLGYELELYEDPYDNYGHLSFEMFRACRLVVDTGMHALGWTRDQAVEFMLENTALHRKNIENEVNRYITWPGQACAYKIGEIKIKELRNMAESQLGKKFDLREFHDVVLQSAGSLSHLEKQIRQYVQRRVK